MADYSFDELVINRLIAHTIFVRGPDKKKKAPELSDQLIPLDVESRDLVQARITKALGSKAHGIAMQISRSDAGSFMQVAAAMIGSNDQDFISSSQQLADALAEAQTSPRWPGGVLIAMSGSVGESQNRFLAVIKAEPDRGFSFGQQGGNVTLNLIKNMLLSQTQRLFKIGMLVEVNVEPPTPAGFAPGNYRAFLFDHLLTATETRDAAAYFYDAFLGMDIVGSSKYQTRLFYEKSKDYINGIPAKQHEKSQMLEALRTELRSNKALVSVAEFAKDHMPKEYQKEYARAMKAQGLPDKGIVKDLEYIKSKLRRPRKVKFTSGVTINVPAEQEFKDYIEIQPQADGHTTVKIKGVVQARE